MDRGLGGFGEVPEPSDVSLMLGPRFGSPRTEVCLVKYSSLRNTTMVGDTSLKTADVCRGRRTMWDPVVDSKTPSGGRMRRRFADGSPERIRSLSDCFCPHEVSLPALAATRPVPPVNPMAIWQYA